MNALLQLQALYNKKSTFYKIFKEVDFFFPLRIIGKGLFLLMSIDAVITDSTFTDSSFILNSWNKYRDSFEMMLTDPKKYGVDGEKLKLLRRVIVKVDKSIMKGDILNAFLNHLSKENNLNVFEEMTDFNNIRSNKYILELLKNYFKSCQSQLEASLSASVHLPPHDVELLNEYLCVFSFYIRFFRVENKDVWRAIWSLQSRVLTVNVHRFVMVRICDVLTRYCLPKKIYSSLEPKEINSFSLEYVKKNQEALPNEVINIYRMLCQWSIKMNSMSCSMFVFQHAKEQERIKVFEQRVTQILAGLNIARRIRHLIRTNLLFRQKLGYNFPENLHKWLLLLVEMSKKLVELVEQKDMQLMQDMMIRFSSLNIGKVIREFCTKIAASKMSDKTFYLEAFKTLFYMTCQHPTEERAHVSAFCMSFLGVKNALKDPEIAQFKKSFSDLLALSTYRQQLREILDCSFLYWYRDIIPNFFTLKTSVDGEYFRFPLLLSAINDAKPVLLQAAHLPENHLLLDKFAEFVMENLTSQVIKRAAIYLEEDLTIQSYHFYTLSAMKVEKPNPMTKFQGDLRRFLGLGKLTVLDRTVDIRYLIESSLSESYYNRISDNQKNFDNFEIMRVLAKVKYDLELGHSYIPSKTVEQGRTDVLAIVRSMMFFVQNFKYNMFNQTFIETLNESTRLKAVSINLISDSIKTHGLGIVKTTINHIAGEIHKMVNSFIGMMSNETLNSLLLRESRWLKSNKEKNKVEDRELRYEFKHAEIFTREFAQTQQMNPGMHKVEDFRLLITYIGNCLAFIRILRTASFNYLSKNIEYLPYIEEIEASFKDTSQVLEFKSKALGDCCVDLDKFIDMMKEKFENTDEKKEETDYLRGLTKRYLGKLSGEGFVKLESQNHTTL